MNSFHQYLSRSVRHQRGLTLIEIMVALVISAFLLAGVIQLFVGSKQTYRGHDALSRIQENGRFALDAMARDIRMAGYMLNRDILDVVRCPDGPVPPTSIQVTSLQTGWCDPVDPDPTVPPTPYQCTPADGICSRDYSVICDGGGGPPCAGSGNLMLDSETTGGNQALIDGVADIRITQLGNGVTIDLLLVSTERFVATEPQTVNFPPRSGTSYTAPDRRLVQIFSTTVAIRNR